MSSTGKVHCLYSFLYFFKISNRERTSTIGPHTWWDSLLFITFSCVYQSPVGLSCLERLLSSSHSLFSSFFLIFTDTQIPLLFRPPPLPAQQNERIQERNVLNFWFLHRHLANQIIIIFFQKTFAPFSFFQTNFRVSIDRSLFLYWIERSIFVFDCGDIF